MDFNEYQTRAQEYALYPNVYNNPEYPTLGLAGEAGEVANKIKKIQRDGLDAYSMRTDIQAELGDVMWYLAMLATEFGLDHEHIATCNIAKLRRRKIEGTIHGAGDNR